MPDQPRNPARSRKNAARSPATSRQELPAPMIRRENSPSENLAGNAPNPEPGFVIASYVPLTRSPSSDHDFCRLIDYVRQRITSLLTTSSIASNYASRRHAKSENLLQVNQDAKIKDPAETQPLIAAETPARSILLERKKQ